MDLNHGKYLGVDYGDKRTGLAECDPSGLIASGICTVSESGMRHTAERVAKEAEARACKKIIIGLPKNMDGSEGFKVEEVRQFIADLTAERQIETIWVDERLTTVSAERALLEADVSRAKRKKVIDKMAAVIILQSYLDRL